MFLVVFYLYNSAVFSQTKKLENLTFVLEKISAKHDVFFTYNPTKIKNIAIDTTSFYTFNLPQKINAVKRQTEYKIEYLGNKYYVVYKYDINDKAVTDPILKSTASNTILPKDTLPTKFLFRGVVINQYYEPIKGVSILENNTQNGTISNEFGEFTLEIHNKNTIQFSHVGYKEIGIQPEVNFMKIMLKSGLELDEISLVGSRNKKRKKIDSPVATDIITLENVQQKSSLLGLNQLIQNEIPSFNATRQSGSDGADHIVPATYRGLGPDQTLILINGKRRHQASLINLYGTRGRGNSGTDLNTIPASAIKKIEILKDGASAQYGSDAIAGVMNIVLKDQVNETTASTTLGIYNANNNTLTSKKGLDGFTQKTDINLGTKINKKGFVNFSAEYRNKAHTFRRGTNIRENYGNAAVIGTALFLNSEIPLGNFTSIYGNGGYSYKNTDAYAFTRPENSERNVKEIYPNGFNPAITSDITDTSINLGIKSSFKNWNIDFSNTFGKNNFQYTIEKTLNATLLEKSPAVFNAGGHSLLQNTTNIDFSKNFPSLCEGLNFAFGFENRVENYTIFAGEEASYASYDTNGSIVTVDTPIENIPSYNGVIRPGGSQGFPGYAPGNEVDESRVSFSTYTDLELDLSKDWIVAAATRFENYSDFGATFNIKLASSYKFSPNTSIRTSISTGFRAPSLAQLYYNLKFTNYIDKNPKESYLIANNNPIIEAFGIQKLQEEKAINYNFSIYQKISSGFNISLDAYYIGIKNRIILSGNFDASELYSDIQYIQFFANGVDTDTYGLDFKINWLKKFTDSKIAIDLTGNFNQMKISDIQNKDLDEEVFFGIREQYFLRASAPDHKIFLNLGYETDKYAINTTLTRFSSLALIDWQIYRPLSDFNNSEKDWLEAALDKYAAKYTLDTHLSYKLSKLFTVQIGANNLFNAYPTEQGPNTDSGGIWDAVQMGSNGAFYYSKLLFSF
ncbi:TonB-dependent receptor [Tenacibaculum sp. SG-28]|nr:TonB-dependent receptor [Tenacibaculum sp. SG-28]